MCAAVPVALLLLVILAALTILRLSKPAPNARLLTRLFDSLDPEQTYRHTSAPPRIYPPPPSAPAKRERPDQPPRPAIANSTRPPSGGRVSFGLKGTASGGWGAAPDPARGNPLRKGFPLDPLPNFLCAFGRGVRRW